jgi:hypothetical protein
MSGTTQDARRVSRIQTSLSCTFGTSEDTPRSGTVTSLSVRGCFVKTTAWANDGMEMYVKLWLLAERRWLVLRSTVLYHLENIGFGLGFTDVTADDAQALSALIRENGGQSARSGPDGDG